MVLSLCDRTGNIVGPWAEAGYECWTVDVQHPPGVGELIGNVRQVGADVRRWCPPFGRRIAMVFAFPPCTDLATSGRRWFRVKGLDALADAIQTVAACARICEGSGAPWMLENPVSTLSTYWRKPDYIFNPCDYAGYLSNPTAEAYTKRTCLWTGGGCIIPQTLWVFPDQGSKMHKLPPSKDRADTRAVTPLGFSRAMYLANCRRVDVQG
jgi:hypothetical protein